MPALIHPSVRPIAGFTLIEMLIVTMIISLLAIVASPTISAYLERVRVARGVSVGRTVQASLASLITTNESNQYPDSIGSYDELTVLINANGGQLKNTEAETGMEFRQYTAIDTDGDSIWDSYTMSFKVLDVSPQRPGWCIKIQPSGVERCPPQ
jgi:prepilin-type N-terminal cleavage/methylation domain-containing protein